MTTQMSREQAAAAMTAAAAERDTIQANLLDLDGSFGRRMLAGASLAGETARRWMAAQAELASLWETFSAYSAVIDQAAAIAATLGRSPAAKIAELTALLTGPSVRLTRAPAPLAVRELTATGTTELTVQAAVSQMRRSYASVAAVCSSAAAVWNEIADGLAQAGTALDEARRQSEGVADDSLTAALGAADASLGQLRQTLNTDPLAFWHSDRVESASLDRLAGQVSAADARARELGQLRRDAGRRIAALGSAIAAARDTRQDALAAQQRAGAKIAGSAPAGAAPAGAAPAGIARPQPMPDLTALAGRVAGLADLQAAGRWARLAAELDETEQQLALATRRWHEAEQAAAALLGRRDELRGLLTAYRAKAARLGAAENEQLELLYGRAQQLLWTAPCDLDAAAAAVTGYQQAVLALSPQERRP
jgi:hypothetical protein